ncbi:MAG: response regulator, partial [Treponema sp.]|nr:response regulator [Treponema sp.]
MERENERKIIFLVDDNPADLAAGKDILKDTYKTYPLSSANSLLDLLEKARPDLILLDVEMSGINGYETLKKINANPLWADIPVIFLTGRTDEGSELEGLSLGAIDYLFKPFSAPLLLKRIENHLYSEIRKRQLKHLNDNLEAIVREKTREVFALQNAVLSTVANLVEFRDDVTGGHINRTQTYIKILLDEMIREGIYGYERASWDLEYFLPSVQLHDVGKIGISDLILNKPGKLSPGEFEIMKTHVT